MYSKNKLTWTGYQNIREKYPHIGSFAYWPDDHKGNKAEPLLVDTEEEFNQKLLGRLHANVVIMGLNFGINNEIKDLLDQQLDNEAFLNGLKKMNNMSNQYGGSYGKKGLNESFKGTFVEGAYMTDFYKFKLAEKDWQATGIPTKDGSKLDTTVELAEFNADGLVHELKEVVQIKEDPIFIFLGQKLSDDQDAKQAILKRFPASKIYTFSHYQRFPEKGTTLKDLFKTEAAELVEKITTENFK